MGFFSVSVAPRSGFVIGPVFPSRMLRATDSTAYAVFNPVFADVRKTSENPFSDAKSLTSSSVSVCSRSALLAHSIKGISPSAFSATLFFHDYAAVIELGHVISKTTRAP